MICAGIYPTLKEDSRGVFPPNLLGKALVPTFSGRSALVGGLRALGLGRMDEILVPPYLGECVLSAMLRTSFPTMTPSSRTRAVLVFHQFGFPQDMDQIQNAAQKHAWFVVNDCAHALFSEWQGEPLYHLGAFSFVSCSKFFSCGLGGGLHSSDQAFVARLAWPHGQTEADSAFQEYRAIAASVPSSRTSLAIHALYGYIPDIGPMASGSARALPTSAEDYLTDRDRRMALYEMARQLCGPLVPSAPGLAPFAIPLSGERSKLEALSLAIRERFGLDAPVLHFDWNRNMLHPDYRPALVVGCHSAWPTAVVEQILLMARAVC